MTLSNQDERWCEDCRELLDEAASATHEGCQYCIDPPEVERHRLTLEAIRQIHSRERLT